MRSAFVVLLLSTALSSGYTPAPTQARPRTIAEAEAEGAAHPRSTASSEAGPRTCLVVTPDRIVFPSTTGNPADYHLRFGDFFAGSISFGWGSTYELAKLPLEPLVPTEAGNGLLIRVIRIDPAPTESTTFELRDLNFTNPRRPFFPSWPRFPTDGKWMVIATAGVNWGCFVLDRPVKAQP